MPEFPTRPSTHSRGQRGVSMIEVMVSCLVLSAGLAVIAAMQTRAVANSGYAVKVAYLSQVLLSFSEARLTDYNIATGNARAGCNGNSIPSTRDGDRQYFRGVDSLSSTHILQSMCQQSLVVDDFFDSVLTCNQPSTASRNVYCSSANFTVDLRQPVWIR